MKRLFLFTFFVSVLFSLSASSFEKGKILFKNGQEKEGYVQTLEGNEKTILFKVEKKSKKEKIVSDSILTIRYEKGAEFEYLLVYKTGITGKYSKLGKPAWMKVVSKGFVSLYTTTTHLQGPDRIGAGGVRFSGGSAAFIIYYVMRKTELGLKIISTESTFNSNHFFKFYGPIFFSDYPELAEKINNKTYTYKNLREVVDIYNKWIEEKNNIKE